jgi:tetratricopeptide (TPR) repeat protein
MITQDETSLAEARAASDSKKELLELNQLGLLNNFTGQPQKSLDYYYEQALVVERAAHDRTAEAGTLTQMGPTYIRLKRPQEAFKSFGDALSIEREQGDRKAEAATLQSLGQAYQTTGDQEKALESYEQALSIEREQGDQLGEAGNEIAMGRVLNSLYQPQKAIDSYDLAAGVLRKVYEGGKDGGEGVSPQDQLAQLMAKSKASQMLAALGSLYGAINAGNTIEFWNRGLAIAREIHNRPLEADLLRRLGVYYNDLGQKDKSIECLEQALPIAREVKDRRLEALTLNSLGGALGGHGRVDEGVSYLTQALQIARELGARTNQIRHWNTSAKQYLSRCKSATSWANWEP